LHEGFGLSVDGVASSSPAEQYRLEARAAERRHGSLSERRLELEGRLAGLECGRRVEKGRGCCGAALGYRRSQILSRLKENDAPTAPPVEVCETVIQAISGEPGMTFKLTILQKPTYLHAVVTGRNSRENVERYLAEVLRECTARNFSRVLIEERLEGPRLQTGDVFEIAMEASEKARRRLKAIAYVDVNAVGALMHFAETVAVNRSLPVAVFSTVADAERWLLDADRLGAGPHAPGGAGEPRR
jgi:hypothetical protein